MLELYSVLDHCAGMAARTLYHHNAHKSVFQKLNFLKLVVLVCFKLRAKLKPINQGKGEKTQETVDAINLIFLLANQVWLLVGIIWRSN